MVALCIGHATYDISVPLSTYPIENEKYYLKEKIESGGGSASNAAYVLGKWNIETYFSGVVGYDDFGSFIKKEMEKSGVRIPFLETSFDKKTSTSFILINESNHTRTIFNIEPEEFHLKKYEYDIEPTVILMDGYEYAASKAAINKYPNAITILDASTPNKELMTLAREIKYIVCSIEFAEGIAGMKMDFNNPVSLLSVYKRIKEKYPNNEILITLKEHGALYCMNNEVKVMPTINVNEIDRTASGDIFRGAFAYALGKNYDLEKSVRIANIAAGLSTSKIGGKDSIPMLSEVIQYYENKFGPIEPTNNQNSGTESPENSIEGTVTNQNFMNNQINPNSTPPINSNNNL